MNYARGIESGRFLMMRVPQNYFITCAISAQNCCEINQNSSSSFSKNSLESRVPMCISDEFQDFPSTRTVSRRGLWGEMFGAEILPQQRSSQAKLLRSLQSQTLSCADDRWAFPPNQVWTHPQLTPPGGIPTPSFTIYRVTPRRCSLGAKTQISSFLHAIFTFFSFYLRNCRRKLNYEGKKFNK